jgi:hypothetical protein
MISSQHTVTTTASEIVPAAESWRTIYIHVAGNGTVYLGGSTVTSAIGMLTEKGAVPFQMILPANETLWAVTAADTEDLRVLRPSGA